MIDDSQLLYKMFQVSLLACHKLREIEGAGKDIGFVLTLPLTVGTVGEHTGISFSLRTNAVILT